LGKQGVKVTAISCCIPLTLAYLRAGFANMDPLELDLDQLTTRLKPYVDESLNQVSKFAGDITSDLSKKAASGLTGLTLGAIRSLGNAIWKRIKSSRAHAAFQRQWEDAQSNKDKEQAIRLLLSSDPKLASSLHSLLVRRDFARAMMEHCEHLPSIGLLDAARRLSDVYVPLSLDAAPDPQSAHGTGTHTDFMMVTTSRAYATPDATIEQLRSGNHLIEGIPGSGKSTLARRLVIREASLLLDNPDAISFDHLRLPAFVNAPALSEAKADFASSLARAVSADMSFAGLGPLPDQFFVPYSDNGHSSWLIVIDGLDEIEDRRERQRLWDMISRLHSQFGDAFRFIITTRPDPIRIREDVAGFTRWSVRSLTTPIRASLARKYIAEDEKAERFIDRIRHSEFSDVMSVPLFETIAASVFVKTGQLPSTKLALCEAFAHTVIETRVCQVEHYRAFQRLLSAVAVNPRVDFFKQPPLDEVIRDLIPRNLPRLAMRDHLEELLVRSGLVRVTAAGYFFLHDVFRSYFLALHLAEQHEPGPNVWRAVDPFVIGWVTPEYLCEAWEQIGKDVSHAADALLAFGEVGERCATEVAIACSTVNSRVLQKIVERIVREMLSTGATVDDLDALTRLARHRDLVKKKLVDLARGERDFGSSKVDCAERLVEAGHIREGTEALLLIADDQDGYDPDRVRAAELLLKNGHEDVARSVLYDAAKHGDEQWARADAACALFEAAPTIENRAILVAVLSEPADDFGRVGEHTLKRVLALGEGNIALPILRERAKPVADRTFNAEVPRDQIEAAKAIASHHNRAEGAAALERLLLTTTVSAVAK
jgi:hypothetical protein